VRVLVFGVLLPVCRVRASVFVAGVPQAYHMAGLGFAQDMAQGLLATRRTFVLLRCNECQAHSVTVAWARPDFGSCPKATQHLDKLEMISRLAAAATGEAVTTPTGGGGARGPQLCPPAAPHFTRMAAGTHAVGSCGVAK